MSFRGFIHEIWLCPSDDGELLPSCIPFGPAGSSARELNEPGSVCIWLFFANSHFEAMQIYYQFNDLGEYTTSEQQDHQPYPESWYIEQQYYLCGL